MPLELTDAELATAWGSVSTGAASWRDLLPPSDARDIRLVQSDADGCRVGPHRDPVNRWRFGHLAHPSPRDRKVLQLIRTVPLRGGIVAAEDNYIVYCVPYWRRTWFTVPGGYLRRLRCRRFRRWRSLTPTSAATQTAITACGLSATTTGTDVGRSPNTAGTRFTAVQVGGCAIPMGTGVILNTLAGRSTGSTTGSTTTTTATDNGSASSFSALSSRPAGECLLGRAATSGIQLRSTATRPGRPTRHAS